MREANSRNDFVFYVTRVDLFGSCLTGAELVNDVNLAVELTPRQADDEACEAARRTARQAGRRFRSLTDELGWPERQLLLFRRGRSRRLSLHDIRELQRLGVPSETIFRVDLGVEPEACSSGSFQPRSLVLRHFMFVDRVACGASAPTSRLSRHWRARK
ncbi:MAG TPA: hypothetical protein PKV98_05890 [Burkholderiaceae bacterium]|nr:hypothetical protein [Burkholderiaceae bacterium]